MFHRVELRGGVLPSALSIAIQIKRSDADRSTWRPSVRHHTLAMLITAVLLIGGAGGKALAADNSGPSSVDQPSNQDLMNVIKALEKRIRTLESQAQRRGAPVAQPNAALPPPTTSPSVASATAAPAQPTAQAAPQGAPPVAGNKDLFGFYPSPIEGLKLGAYGEFKFGSQQNPNANGKWQTGFDAGRLVLLPTFQFTDNITFNAEIEFEHGGIAFDADDKLHGTAEVEQAYIDFKVRDYLNFHSPGVDLVPIGYTNQTHEPTTFYSVNRPELANGLIPTTLDVPSWGTVYGQITNDLGYQFQISQSLEDFGDDFVNRTEAGTVTPLAYAAGIDGKNALGLSKPPVGGFLQINNTLAYDLRVSYTPPFVPGLAGSTSVYFSPNVEPRGAHSDAGTDLGKSSLTLVDSELRYRIPSTGFELRGEYVQAFFGNPANLRANNDTDPTNNVGSTMWGISGEVAYHIPLGRALGGDWEAVPFYRYTYENLQTGGFRGTDDNAPTGAGQLHFHTFGAAFFPTPKLVLKLNYQHVQDGEPGGANSDSVLGGVGFFF
jgi:hypothetical protein